MMTKEWQAGTQIFTRFRKDIFGAKHHATKVLPLGQSPVDVQHSVAVGEEG